MILPARRAAYVLFSIATMGCPSSSSSSSSSPSSSSSTPASTTPLQVAAAADLASVMPRIVEAYGREGGGPVVVTHGASGQLAAQLRAGAPFSVYLSANEAFVDDAIAHGACLATSKAIYARGTLALVSRLGLVPAARDLSELGAARIGAIALANPVHAPYGQAARAALQSAGLWDEVSARVVVGDSVRQALQLVESGNADVGLVSHALALASTMPATKLDDSLYPPLWQALAVCDTERLKEASAFARFLTSSTAQDILRSAGFSPPPSSSTGSTR